MPYINVNDVYIMDNTGKQVDDAVDYALANSNRNLLDNPWWGSGEVVNQRQITAKPSNGSYGIDRWIFTSGADANTISLGASGITFTISASYIWQVQRFPNVAAWSGKTLTASVLFSNGTIKSGSKPFTLGTAVNFFEDSTVALTMNTSGYFSVTIKATSTIRAVKLELGSYSTLANDVPPDYGEELRKCQYYCRVIQGTSFIAVGQAVASTVIRFPLPYVMRARPTATLTGTAQVYGQGGPLTPSALSCTGNTTQGIEISTNVSGATATQSYMLVFSSASDKIVISADL